VSRETRYRTSLSIRVRRFGAMKPNQLKQYRTQLDNKRAELLARVQEARSSEHSQEKEGAPDLGDRALETMSRDLLYQLSIGERDIVRRIDAALERLEAGTYGTCVHCGETVQTGRLQAVPWARHCLDCQELQDRGEI
jgi:DnaK suppressor protein